MSPKASFLPSLFKAPIWIEKCLCLKISLHWRMFSIFILWTNDIFWEFDHEIYPIFCLQSRSYPNKMWLKHFSVYTSIFNDLANPPRQCTCFHLGMGSIWLNNNWVWFDFSRHGFARKYTLLIFQKHIKRSNSNAGKGLLALIVLVGLITFKKNISFRFFVKPNI